MKKNEKNEKNEYIFWRFPADIEMINLLCYFYDKKHDIFHKTCLRLKSISLFPNSIGPKIWSKIISLPPFIIQRITYSKS